MILKSFLVEKNLSIIDEYFATLFYGENIGLKDEIKKRIKEKYKNYEQINFNQDEVIKKGDCSMTFEGGHTYEILEDDTIVYEYKTGPYFGQILDKEFIRDHRS